MWALGSGHSFPFTTNTSAASGSTCMKLIMFMFLSSRIAYTNENWVLVDTKSYQFWKKWRLLLFLLPAGHQDYLFRTWCEWIAFKSQVPRWCGTDLRPTSLRNGFPCGCRILTNKTESCFSYIGCKNFKPSCHEPYYNSKVTMLKEKQKNIMVHFKRWPCAPLPEKASLSRSRVVNCLPLWLVRESPALPW